MQTTFCFHDWVKFIQEGDSVYLTKEKEYATILGRAVWSHSIYKVFLRRAGSSRIEQWFIRPFGYGFDGTLIIEPIRGFVHASIEDADVTIAIKEMLEKINKLEKDVEYLKAMNL